MKVSGAKNFYETYHLKPRILNHGKSYTLNTWEILKHLGTPAPLSPVPNSAPT